MLHASYKSDNDIYEVVQASLDDIDNDIELALADIDTIDDGYRDRMVESVNQKLGYRLLKNGNRIGIMYNAVINGEYVGCSIYCKNDRVGMVILLKSMFEVYDWHKILIMPYGDGLKYFVSMASAGSIKEYHTRKTPLAIIRKDIEPLGKRVFDYLKIKEL